MQIGPYRVLDELGRGGLGIVYRARDARGHEVALKLLKGLDSVAARERFARETEALTRLRHPNVVRCYAAGEYQGDPWLALELVEGESLQDRLRAGPLPVERAILVAQQLGDALRHVHAAGLLHRDVKPDNVLLFGWELKLTDFGLVRDVQDARTQLSRTGVFLGTPGYWAPEQAQGNRALQGSTTDVYGLGALLYACLTGGPPVAGKGLVDFLRSAAFREIPSPRRLRADVPDWLSLLCMRCLSVAPSERPSLERVNQCLGLRDARPLAPDEEPQPAPDSPPRRGRITVRLALGLGAAAVGALAFALTRGQPEQAPSSPPLASAAPEAEPEPQPQPQPESGTYSDPADQRLAQEIERALAQSAAGDDVGAQRTLTLASEARTSRTAPMLNTRVEEAAATLMLAKQRREALADPRRAERVRGSREHLLAARSCVERDAFEEALARLRDALRLDPLNAHAYQIRAGLHAELGDLEAAQIDSNFALALDPDLAPAHLIRAKYLASRRRHAEALAATDRALALRPDDPEAHARRATTLLTLGRAPEALRAYDRALELRPGSLGDQANRGLALRDLGHVDEALAIWDRLAASGELDGEAQALVDRWRAEARAEPR